MILQTGLRTIYTTPNLNKKRSGNNAANLEATNCGCRNVRERLKQGVTLGGKLLV